MKPTFFYLHSCSTCQRILKELPQDKMELHEIKSTAITASQLEKMAELAGSYEALFSRRAMKYKSMGLADKNLSEEDYRQLILDEYTFLKRPVLLGETDIAVGNTQKSVAKMKEMLA